MGLFVLVLTPDFATAQSTGTIAGTVVEAETDAPLAGANVLLEDDRTGAAAAADGSFVIESVSPGSHELQASVLGFATARQSVTVRAGETTRVTFRLTEQPVEISELIVERTMLTGAGSRLDDLPGSAHYIGPRELEEFSYNDVHRVLRGVPGVYVQEEDGYGLRPNIGLRGSGLERSSKVTVMEDGVLAAPAPYAAPAAYYFPTVGRMHGVEVRKGSSQIQHGPFTTGGAINFLSTTIPTEFSGRVNGLAGSDEERTIHATVGDSYDHFGFVAETYQTRASGFKTLTGFDNANAGLDYDTGFDKKDYLAKGRINTDRDADIYQELMFKVSQTTETSNETYLGLTDQDFEANPYIRYAGSQEDVMNTEHSGLQLRHFIRPATSVDVTTTAYRNTFQRNWFKLDQVRAVAGGEAVGIGALLANPTTYADALAIVRGQASPNEDALDVKNNNREYLSQGVQTVMGVTFDDGAWGHELEFGGRYHEDEIDRFQWVNTYRMAPGGVMQLTHEGTPGTESNRIQSAQAWAGFAQYRLTYGNAAVTPGVRYENIALDRRDYGTNDPERTGQDLSVRENNVSILIPGLGVTYDFTAEVSIFAGVHRGFAPPGARPQTDPETSINYELGTRYANTVLNLEGVVFFNDYTNLLGADLQAGGGSGTLDQFNGGAVNVTGLELSGTTDLGLLADAAFSIPLDVVYTFTQATFQNSFESDFGAWGTVEEGDKLPYLPAHQMAVGLGLKELSGFNTSVNTRFVSEVRTVAGQGAPHADQRINGHVVLDLAAGYQITPFAQVYGMVRNLADNAYAVARRPAGLRPGLPRTFRLGVKTHF
jgi:Fe(3+) dicitrate transport protein